ncbi:MAG: hypothetical protein KGJ98_13100 [Chloroflexota bacterium]|nr:hypothetical protein [Chloroflexota bacterium]
MTVAAPSPWLPACAGDALAAGETSKASRAWTLARTCLGSGAANDEEGRTAPAPWQALSIPATAMASTTVGERFN